MSSNSVIEVGKLLDKAFELKTRGNADDAIQTFKKLVELDPSVKQAYYFLGELYLKKK